MRTKATLHRRHETLGEIIVELVGLEATRYDSKDLRSLGGIRSIQGVILDAGDVDLYPVTHVSDEVWLEFSNGERMGIFLDAPGFTSAFEASHF